MVQPFLSILIPTVIGRENEFDKLKSKLTEMSINLPPTLIEVQVMIDDKKMTIGEKRERLYKKANGLYAWQIDDDDDIDGASFQLILKAIGEGADCITFQERCEINGEVYKSNHSLDYGDWEGDGSALLWDGFHFHRTPFYKNVIKTEIAKSVPFEKIRFGEDHAWSRALRPHLKSETHIPKDIYIYQHQSTDFNTRYGFDQ